MSESNMWIIRPGLKEPKVNQQSRMKENQALGNRLSEQEIDFITQCLKEGKPLPDSYRHIIPARGFAQFSIFEVVVLVEALKVSAGWLLEEENS